MRCSVYRSRRKAETYLFLAADRSFGDLPEELRSAFGEPVFVMSLELSAGRKLARADSRQVAERLAAEGYFLQLPPELPVEEQITRGLSPNPAPGRGKPR